jgi:preprotein translocase SecE subunit
MRKFIQFFRDVKAEMTKVIWPTKYDVIRYTATVIVFSIVMAAILGAADLALLKGFEALIKDRQETSEQTVPAESTEQSAPTEQPASEANPAPAEPAPSTQPVGE